MKIIIIGAGEIGYELASVLSEENHDVIVLDNNRERLTEVAESLDVLVYEGNATSSRDLTTAKVPNADILIAVTSIDEVNMIAAMIGKKLGAKTVIARVRNDEYSRPNAPVKPIDLGIDVMINPEMSAAQEIGRLLMRSAASDVVDLADGRMQVIGIRLGRNSKLIGKSLIELASEYDHIIFRVIAVGRRKRTITPKGNFKFQAYDQVFILAKTEDIQEVIKATGKKETNLHHVMIAGGTKIGAMLAWILTNDTKKDWSIKLIEPNYETAEELAIELDKVMVLHGKPTDPDLLAAEGIIEMDAFIAVSEDEESNIIASLMAKHLDVKKTITLVSKPDFIPLSQTIGLETVINKKIAATNEIHRFVHKGRLVSITELRDIRTEVIELIASKNSKVVGKRVDKLKLPENCIIGGIVCDGNVQIVTGTTQIKENDRVIVFCFPEAIDKVTRLFH